MDKSGHLTGAHFYLVNGRSERIIAAPNGGLIIHYPDFVYQEIQVGMLALVQAWFPLLRRLVHL